MYLSQAQVASLFKMHDEAERLAAVEDDAVYLSRGFSRTFIAVVGVIVLIYVLIFSMGSYDLFQLLCRVARHYI